MVLTEFRDLLGIKDSCPGGQCKCPCLQQGYQALQEPLLLLVGLQKTDRQLDDLSRDEQAEASGGEAQPLSG